MFFSVVIPLYNKQKHIKETIETVLKQTFKDYEIVVVNDGSIDSSVKIVENIQDNRIRIINQKNQGVSVARNNGIKSSKGEYIAFLDADDIWLPHYLQTIYDLTINYPDAGLYATKYEKMDRNGETIPIVLKALPTEEYIGIIPNYFKSHALGDNPTWTSALCIPKKIFIKNDIWFPVGEKYGEDIHVWSQIAMTFDIAYNTKICAYYIIDSDNNSSSNIQKEKEPHKSIMSLKNFSFRIQDKEKIKYLDKYIEKHIAMIILFNMKNKNRIYGLKQLLKYKLSIKHNIKLIIISMTPMWLYSILKRIKKVIS